MVEEDKDPGEEDGEALSSGRGGEKVGGSVGSWFPIVFLRFFFGVFFRVFISFPVVISSPFRASICKTRSSQAVRTFCNMCSPVLGGPPSTSRFIHIILLPTLLRLLR